MLPPLESSARISPIEPKIREVPKQLAMIEMMPKATDANAMVEELLSEFIKNFSLKSQELKFLLFYHDADEK